MPGWRPFRPRQTPVVADARRERRRDECLPWDHISCGVSKDYLWREYERATQGQITRDCREGCTNCGAIEMLECSGQPSSGPNVRRTIVRRASSEASDTTNPEDQRQRAREHIGALRG